MNKNNFVFTKNVKMEGLGKEGGRGHWRNDINK